MKKMDNNQKLTNGEIYTKLKFIKSDLTGALISFVSKNPVTGRVNGVRQDSKFKKKVCVVSNTLAQQHEILINTLYDCTLMKMAEKNGYIVVAAEPVQFDASIVTTYVKNTFYKVEVKFGNKNILFDPFTGKKESVKSLKACKEVLEKRVDVKNIVQVVADFEKAANEILQLMNFDSNRRFRK